MHKSPHFSPHPFSLYVIIHASISPTPFLCPISPFSTFLIPGSFALPINQLQPNIQFSPLSPRSICHLVLLFLSLSLSFPTSADEIIPLHSVIVVSAPRRPLPSSASTGIDHSEHESLRCYSLICLLENFPRLLESEEEV